MYGIVDFHLVHRTRSLPDCKTEKA